MNTLHTSTSMITRYCAPPIINPEPQAITIMSRCHEYDGPEWTPEWNSPNAWLSRHGYRMAGTRIISPGRSTFHLAHNKSCPVVMQATKGYLTITTKARSEFERLEPAERCRHCQNSIVE